jgi:O-antigen biosynthesis protein
MKAGMDVQTHVYGRDIDPQQAQDSLSKIFRAIPSGSRVLDVGVGSGALGRWLTARKSATVDGITYNDEEQSLASKHYRELHLLDLERDALPDALLQNRYDVVVFADVLEHLRNAHTVLRSFQKLLAEDGAFIISIPNVGHSAVVLNLLANRIERTNEGLLDSTHVHLLDRMSLGRLVRAAGLAVVGQDEVRKSTADSEFRGENWLQLPTSVRQYVQSRPDADVYQFIWTLKPAPAGIEADPQDLVLTPQVVATYVQKLYWTSGDGFDESNSLVRFAANNQTCTETKFAAPWAQPPLRLRLNVADQLGVAELLDLSVYAKDVEPGTTLKKVGEWIAGSAHCLSAGLRWLDATGPNGGALVQVMHTDAHIILDCATLAPQNLPWTELVWRAVAPNPLVAAEVLSNRAQLDDLALRLEQSKATLVERLQASTHAANEQVVRSTQALGAALQTRFEHLHSAQAKAEQVAQEAQRIVMLLEAQRSERQVLENSLMQLAAERHMALLNQAQTTAAQTQPLFDMKAMVSEMHGSLMSRLAQSEQAQATLNAQLQRVYASRSWRFSWPIRALEALVRKLLGRT